MFYFIAGIVVGAAFAPVWIDLFEKAKARYQSFKNKA